MKANTMEIIKTKKQGNSVIITIHASLGVAEGEEFHLQRSDNRIISLVPKIRDYFENANEMNSANPCNGMNCTFRKAEKKI